MPQYALARHVFVCAQGEHVVFLDVRNDRYFTLERTRTSGLGALVPGWPEASAHQVEENALDPLVTSLLERGILTADPADGKPAAAAPVDVPRVELTAEALDDTPRIGVVRALRFMLAAGRAVLALKLLGFERVIERVRQRNERVEAAQGRVEREQLHELIGVFATLRPFFFTTKNECLFEALALSEFLAGYRIFPRWVFGVHARPFAAHCWLQHDGCVLNDTLEHVKRYTPIMIV